MTIRVDKVNNKIYVTTKKDYNFYTKLNLPNMVIVYLNKPKVQEKETLKIL